MPNDPEVTNAGKLDRLRTRALQVTSELEIIGAKYEAWQIVQRDPSYDGPRGFIGGHFVQSLGNRHVELIRLRAAISELAEEQDRLDSTGPQSTDG